MGEPETTLNRRPAKDEGLALPPIPQLDEELRRLIRLIPAGSVMTCGDLAELLGDRAAARWVGEFVRDEPPARCPVHRVVRQTGELTRTRLSPSEACERLQSEGVRLRGQQVALADHRQLPSHLGPSELQFTNRTSRPPLQLLADWQQAFEQRAPETKPSLDGWPIENPPRNLTSTSGDSPRQFRRPSRYVLGVDVSYRDGAAWACCVEFDVETGEVTSAETTCIERVFPYIPGYLAFREAPAMLAAIRRLRRHSTQAGLLLVDGNGRLHPRRAGIACLVGAVVDLPTIGVGKSLLCGQRQQAHGIAGCRHVVTLPFGQRPVSERTNEQPAFEREIVAAELAPTGSRKPLYVSTGWKISLDQAVEAVWQLMLAHRLPEPLYWADRLSRSAARTVRANN